MKTILTVNHDPHTRYLDTRRTLLGVRGSA